MLQEDDENCDGGNEVHYEDTPQHCNYQILAPIIRTHFRTLIGRGDIALRQDTPGGNTFSLGALPIECCIYSIYPSVHGAFSILDSPKD